MSVAAGSVKGSSDIISQRLTFQKSDTLTSDLNLYLDDRVTVVLCDAAVQHTQTHIHTKWKLYSIRSAQYYLFSVCQLSPPTEGLSPAHRAGREIDSGRGTVPSEATGGHTSLPGLINTS